MYKRFLDRKPIDAKKSIWKTPIRLRDGHRHPRIDLLPCDLELIGEDLGGGQTAGAYVRCGCQGGLQIFFDGVSTPSASLGVFPFV